MRLQLRHTFIGNGIGIGIVWVLVGVLGCGGDDDDLLGAGTPCVQQAGIVEAGTVEREDWSVVLDEVPFPDGIERIAIGTSEVDNFNNRGDVEVRLDGPEGVITVEARRFAAGDTAAEIATDLEHLSIVASSGGAPASTNDCASEWKEDCVVTAFDDRGAQPPSTGADLRVTLPSSYRGELVIETADMLAVDGYFGRSDVWVVDVKGDLDVLLDSGEARVYIDRSARPGATQCSEAAVDACEAWTDPVSGAPDPWSFDCPCTEYGSIRVRTRCQGAANITVDVPPNLWATALGNNKQPGLTRASDPTCTASVDCSNMADCRDDQFEESQPWRRGTELNDPSPDDPASTAIHNGGVNLNLTSEGCEFVDVHGAPGDYPGLPQPQRRGDVQLCSGCLEAELP